MPIRIGKHLYTIRLVAIERKNSIEVNPKMIKLYDLLVDKEIESSGKPAKEDNVLTGRTETLNEISIREMLKDVKDA